MSKHGWNGDARDWLFIAMMLATNALFYWLLWTLVQHV